MPVSPINNNNLNNVQSPVEKQSQEQIGALLALQAVIGALVGFRNDHASAEKGAPVGALSAPAAPAAPAIPCHDAAVPAIPCHGAGAPAVPFTAEQAISAPFGLQWERSELEKNFR